MDETDIDIRLEQGSTNLLERLIKLLKSQFPQAATRREGSDTFSSMGEEPWRSLKAEVKRRPRSERTIVQRRRSVVPWSIA